MAHALSAAVNSAGWSHNHSDNSLKHFLKLARNTTVLYRTRVNPLSFSQCWFHGLFEHQDWTEKSKKRESVVVFLWEKPLSVIFSSIRDEFNKTFASVIYKCSFCFWTLKTIATLVEVLLNWSDPRCFHVVVGKIVLFRRHELHRQCHHFASELISGRLTCALSKSLLYPVITTFQPKISEEVLFCELLLHQSKKSSSLTLSKCLAKNYCFTLSLSV